MFSGVGENSAFNSCGYVAFRVNASCVVQAKITVASQESTLLWAVEIAREFEGETSGSLLAE